MSDNKSQPKSAPQEKPVLRGNEAKITNRGSSAANGRRFFDLLAKFFTIFTVVGGVGTSEGWPSRIRVGFKKPLSVPPILTSLYDSAQINAERGKGLDWEFEIQWSVEPVGKDDRDRIYRLEVIP